MRVNDANPKHAISVVMAKAPPTVDLYIAARVPKVRALLERLRKLVADTRPEAEEMMKWGAPVWCARGDAPEIYLYGGKDHANLGFVQGVGLDDPQGLLKGKGESGRHVKLWPDKPMPEAALIALIRQCFGGDS